MKEIKEWNKGESVGRKGKGKMMQLYYNLKKIKVLIKDSHGGVCLQIQSWEDRVRRNTGPHWQASLAYLDVSRPARASVSKNISSVSSFPQG